MCEIDIKEWRKFSGEEEKMKLKPIGVVHTPFKNLDEMPSQAYLSETEGEIEIFQDYLKGLKGVEGFSHIMVFYLFHRVEGYCLQLNRCMDGLKHGLFATRAPYRPNPIGISTVRLLGVNGNKLKVKGVDMLDGTPLLDIKPYVPRYDNRKDANMGWFKEPLERIEYQLWEEKVFSFIERLTGRKIERKTRIIPP